MCYTDYACVCFCLCACGCTKNLFFFINFRSHLWMKKIIINKNKNKKSPKNASQYFDHMNVSLMGWCTGCCTDTNHSCFKYAVFLIFWLRFHVNPIFNCFYILSSSNLNLGFYTLQNIAMKFLLRAATKHIHVHTYTRITSKKKIFALLKLGILGHVNLKTMANFFTPWFVIIIFLDVERKHKKKI